MQEQTMQKELFEIEKSLDILENDVERLNAKRDKRVGEIDNEYTSKIRDIERTQHDLLDKIVKKYVMPVLETCFYETGIPNDSQRLYLDKIMSKSYFFEQPVKVVFSTESYGNVARTYGGKVEIIVSKYGIVVNAYEFKNPLDHEGHVVLSEHIDKNNPVNSLKTALTVCRFKTFSN
ncbi:MAG TPA: hypothetical protein VJH34_03720 [archaeon]|nr:hypothetical protein [archaeon]